MQTGGSI